MKYLDKNKRYYTLDSYYKEKYGTKVFKVTLDLNLILMALKVMVAVFSVKMVVKQV